MSDTHRRGKETVTYVESGIRVVPVSSSVDIQNNVNTVVSSPVKRESFPQGIVQSVVPPVPSRTVITEPEFKKDRTGSEKVNEREPGRTFVAPRAGLYTTTTGGLKSPVVQFHIFFDVIPVKEPEGDERHAESIIT